MNFLNDFNLALRRFIKNSAILTVGYLICLVPTTHAQAIWNVWNGSFTDGANWLGNNGNPPDSSVSALIDNGGTALLYQPASAGGITIGNINSGTLQLFDLAISPTFTNSGNAVIGNQAGSNGVANINGGQWSNTGSLQIGVAGIGSMNITNNGIGSVETVSSESAILGVTSGKGTVTVDGGIWNNSTTLTIGRFGTGQLIVQNGGTVTDSDGHVGYGLPGVGTVTVNGVNSKWENGDTLTIGEFGTGTVNVQNGATVNAGVLLMVGRMSGSSGTLNIHSGGKVMGGDDAYFGYNNGSGVVTIDGAGSLLTCFALTVGAGNNGVGTLTLQNSAQLNLFNGVGTLNLASVPSSQGTLNIGGGGAAGTLLAAGVHGGGGTAKIVFNHNEAAYLFIPEISGSTSVEIKGGGTTILSAANTYTGNTTVQNSTLVVNNTTGSATGTGTVTVTGILMGTGIIDGNTFINGNGILRAGTINDPLHFNHNLSMDSLSQNTSLILNVGRYSGGVLQCENIEVDGVFFAAGYLSVDSVGDMDLVYGDSFQLFTCGSIIGTFADVELLGINDPNLHWDISELYTTGTITVVPEPSTWALLACGLAGFFAVRFFRRSKGAYIPFAQFFE